MTGVAANFSNRSRPTGFQQTSPAAAPGKMFRKRSHTIYCGEELVIDGKLCEVPDDILPSIKAISTIDYEDVYRASSDARQDRSGIGNRRHVSQSFVSREFILKSFLVISGISVAARGSETASTEPLAVGLF